MTFKSRYLLDIRDRYRRSEGSTYFLEASDLTDARKEAYNKIVEYIGGEDCEYLESEPEDAFRGTSATLHVVTESIKLDMSDPQAHQAYSDAVEKEKQERIERHRQQELREYERLKQKLETFNKNTLTQS